MRSFFALLLASRCHALVTDMTLARNLAAQNSSAHPGYSSLAGRTLRVAFIQYQDEVKAADPGCCVDGRSCVNCTWIGNVIDVYTEIQAMAGFSIEEVMVSDESTAIYPDYHYDACVRDVALGKVDLCLTTVWPWARRLAMSQFALPFGEDTIGLVMPFSVEEVTTTQDQKVTWLFNPVHLSVWLTFLGVTLMTGLTLFVTEGGCESESSQHRCEETPTTTRPTLAMRLLMRRVSEDALDDAIKEAGSHDMGEVLKNGLLAMMAQGEEAHEELEVSERACHYWGPRGHLGVCIKRLFRVLYAVFLAMLSSGGNLHGDDAKPRSLGGKLIVSGITIFSTLFFALYTAQLTTMTVEKEVTYGASSLYDLPPSSSVCMMKGLVSELNETLSGHTIVPMSDTDMFGEKAGSGLTDKCDALAISLRNNNELAQHCETVGLANPSILTLLTGQPAAHDVAPALTYYLAEMRKSGMLEDFREKHYGQSDSCSAFGVQDGDDGNEFSSVKFGQMAILLYLTAASCAFAIAEYAFRLYRGESMMRNEYLSNSVKEGYQKTSKLKEIAMAAEVTRAFAAMGATTDEAKSQEADHAVPALATAFSNRLRLPPMGSQGRNAATNLASFGTGSAAIAPTTNDEEAA